MKVPILLILSLLGWSQCSQLDQQEQHFHKDTAKTVLNLLVTAPYPPSDGGWDGGLAVIPAVRLALRQINEHPDFLPGYTLRAIEDNSGCQVTLTSSISFMKNIFYSSLNFVGIIGPGCSGSTIELAPVLSRPNISLIQLAPAATSPQIETLNQSTTFTMRAPFQMVRNTVDLLRRNNWTKFAFLYDNSRNVFRTLHDVIITETTKNNIVTNFDSTIVDNEKNFEVFFPLDSLKESHSRIVVILAELRTVQKIMCVAYKMGMLYPIYQWILLEKSLDGLIVELKSFEANKLLYSCTKEQMRTVLDGSIITRYVLNRTDETIITPLNISYSEYRALYNHEFHCYLNDSKVKNFIKASNKSTEYFIRDDHWENPYYDAAWVFGLALHSIIKKGVNLKTYRYGQPDITSKILEEFYKIKFQGASSLIQFSSNRNAPSQIITTNLTSVNVSEIKSNFLCLYNSSEILSCADDNYFAIHDTFEQIPQKMHLGVGILIIIFAFVITILTICLQITTVKYSDRKSVKATSPNMSHLIFPGCYLYCMATILYAFQQTLLFNVLLYSILCNTIMWCVVVGTSLIFGTILVKVWRVFRIFRHFRSRSPGLLLKDRVLVLEVLFLVIIDIIFCICWNNLDPYFMKTQPIMNSGIDANIIRVKLQCECNNIYLWIAIIMSLKGPLIILIVIISILNRKIKRKHFSHTKKVNILVYSLTILCGTGFPLFFVLTELNDSVYVSLIFCFVLLGSVILCCLLLFIPPIRDLNSKTKQLTIYSTQ